jgi:outer membrane receptor protein involved in Fe transport
LQVGWRFVHADDFTNTSDASLRRESYDLHHAYVQWRAGGEDPLAGLGVTFGIDNIFDKDYARVANSASEPGRNFKVTVNYRTTW